MGNNFGPADDPEMQLRIMRDAFQLIETATSDGVLVDLPYTWPTDFEYFTGKRRA
jgi:hypothetical protein